MDHRTEPPLMKLFFSTLTPPPPQPPLGGIKAARIIFLAVVGAIGIDRTMILKLQSSFLRVKVAVFGLTWGVQDGKLIFFERTNAVRLF